ncbi:hypothetical protein T492DRAFT_563800, partial [Pavlovales sp. CCMP2436]
QMPQPMQSDSEIHVTFEVFVTSMHALPARARPRGGRAPMRTTGQPFLHSCAHFFGL